MNIIFPTELNSKWKFNNLIFFRQNNSKEMKNKTEINEIETHFLFLRLSYIFYIFLNYAWLKGAASMNKTLIYY